MNHYLKMKQKLDNFSRTQKKKKILNIKTLKMCVLVSSSDKKLLSGMDAIS